MRMQHPVETRVIREDAAAVASRLPAVGDATVLVTGSSGMLGGYLVAVLEAAGARVVTAQRRGKALVLPADRVDHIIHAGSPSDPDAFRTDPVGTLAASTSTLVQLLDHAQANGAHLGFVSTTDAAQYLDPLDPHCCYRTAKCAGEALCAAYHRQHGVPTSIVRLAQLYGPGFRPDSSAAWTRFVRAACSGEVVVVRPTDQRQLRWTYVADAAEAVLRTTLTAAARTSTVAFEAVDERSRCDLRAFARLVLRSAGRPAALAYQLGAVDPAPSRAAGPADPGERPPGWKPRTSLREGIGRTVRWYRDVSVVAPREVVALGG